MSRIVTVAATQMACSWDSAANIANAEKLVRQAAAQGDAHKLAQLRQVLGLSQES